MSTSHGQVVGLFTASAAGEPTQSHDSVELVPGVGIPGDRYATRAGFWSDPRWPDQELTLVEEELAFELGVEPSRMRRNLVTRGVDLASLIGAQFTIGDTLLRGVRNCDPCAHLEGLTRPGLLRDLGGRGGLRAAIVTGGTVGAGDTVSRAD